MIAEKVVFIMSSCSQNPIKRINEFVARGVNIDAYGFQRDKGSGAKPDKIEVQIIGNFPSSMPYKNRVAILRKGIKQVVNKYKNQNVLYYAFGLDVAAILRMTCRKPYIYEEEDLVYTYFGSKLLVKAFNKLDKYIVKKSFLTVFTSEGFVQYHFGRKCPENVMVIPNKLKRDILNYSPLFKSTNMEKLRIGYVGYFKFDSVYHFAKTFAESFPQHEFHFFGVGSTPEIGARFEQLQSFSNCFFHGRYKNPSELPDVYSKIDLLLSTYDIKYENVKYAEPNKIYESIYFETPIIATTGTFLAGKILELGIGYSINPLDDAEINKFISTLTLEDIEKKVSRTKEMGKMCSVDNYDELFSKLNRFF